MYPNYKQYLNSRGCCNSNSQCQVHVVSICGPTGPQGPVGETGPTGPTGPTGGSPWVTMSEGGYTGPGYTGDVIIDGNLLLSGIMPRLGGGIITVPTGFSGSAPIPENGVVFIGLSELPYTVIFDPATFYVGRVVVGAQMAAGNISFAGPPGTTVTVYNVNGQLVPPGEPAIFQGGYGAIVCTERTDTTMTIRFFIGTFGSPSLRQIAASATGTVLNQAGANKVISYSTSPIDFQFDPATCCPYGQSIYIAQLGTGTLTLGAAPGRTVTFKDSTGSVIPGPTITQGNSITLVSTEHSATAVTLQELPA